MIIIELFSRQKPIMRIFFKSKKRFPNDGLMKMQTYRILQDICGFTGTNVCFRYLPCFNLNFS